jgi:hypothetical protein
LFPYFPQIYRLVPWDDVLELQNVETHPIVEKKKKKKKKKKKNQNYSFHGHTNMLEISYSFFPVVNKTIEVESDRIVPHSTIKRAIPQHICSRNP